MGYSQGFQTPAPSGSQRGYNQGGGSGASTSYPSQGKGKAKAKSSAQAYALGVDDHKECGKVCETFSSSVEAVKEANVESKALLCLDVVTRWNSTYMMLEAALKYKSVFKYMEGDPYYTKYFEEERVNGEKLDDPPEASDWSNAEVFVKFLNSFYQLTLKFSGLLYVTSNLFFQEILQVQVELNDTKASKDELISKMAGSMQLKFNKYWGNVEKVNLLQYIASILDPRFKLDVVQNGFRYLYDAITVEIMIKKVENMRTSLYAFYQKIVVLLNSSNDQQATENATFKSNASSSSTSLLIKLRFVSSEVATNDLDDYLNDRKEKLLDNVDFDILDWWKRNSSKYPIVSHVAKDVLAVQISSVASESTFSNGGRILDPFRSSLSPKTVEALICSKN
ncbi:zinc finger BED domain-containing protein RICESLEEPER 2-like [Cannabis sativa]|uniref:zinc finger BED domain-containing protein RICESLEEPER 2-like n=1 Tax=Cannabis sativa TaxID=3483 RepID=UPI0029CA3F78|nr:zinc finger BED domain-containing protein RICESLEEPER 2-like [Cannabis sativa]